MEAEPEEDEFCNLSSDRFLRVICDGIGGEGEARVSEG